LPLFYLPITLHYKYFRFIRHFKQKPQIYLGFLKDEPNLILDCCKLENPLLYRHSKDIGIQKLLLDYKPE